MFAKRKWCNENQLIHSTDCCWLTHSKWNLLFLCIWCVTVPATRTCNTRVYVNGIEMHLSCSPCIIGTIRFNSFSIQLLKRNKFRRRRTRHENKRKLWEAFLATMKLRWKYKSKLIVNVIQTKSLSFSPSLLLSVAAKSITIGKYSE